MTCLQHSVRAVAGIGFLCAAVAATPSHATEAQVHGELIGAVETHRTVYEDTLPDIAWHYRIGYVELRVVNPDVDPWVPGEGVEITLPKQHVLPDAPREGIVVNIADRRLYYFQGIGKPVLTYPIGTPRDEFAVPLGETSVVRKREKPTWFPTDSMRAQNPDLPAAVPPGPDNPLGEFALYLGWPRYIIHGTNKPYGVGRRVSRGCIRLYPEDIEDLYGRVSAGVRITVVDQPIKAGWSDGELYLQAHPTQDQADEIEQTGRFTPEPAAGVEDYLHDKAGTHVARIDWTAVHRVVDERRGVPVRITRRVGEGESLARSGGS